MKAGNWSNYQEFCRATDWMDPWEAHAEEDAAWDRAWEDFCDRYEEKYGEQEDEDWDMIKVNWEDIVDLSEKDSDSRLLEMSVDEMIKEGMDVDYWYDKYRKECLLEHTRHNYDKKYLPLGPKEWKKEFYDTRLEAMVGFNTKQLWVYDNVRDVYIDPPAEVLDSLPDWREDSDKAEEALLEICKTEPDWLFDRQYWYGDEDFEI